MTNIKGTSHFSGTSLAATVVTNSWFQSLRFYQDALAYKQIDSGTLTAEQQKTFGDHLTNYVLLGQDRGPVVRLLNSTLQEAEPNRVMARPWDPGLCVMEIGVADVDAIYTSIIRNRFGILAPPTTFSVKGPEPLGFVEMRAVAVLGPAGEQLFMTQIMHRDGGTPLWEQRKDINVFPLGNIVLSMKDRQAQQFYADVFHLYPETDLVLKQKEAAFIMGGPADMGFGMCLMGNGMYKSGMEQHIYQEHNPSYDFNAYPCEFKKTGLASACWQGLNLEGMEDKIRKHGGEILSSTLLPIRGNSSPEGIVFRGLVGEIIELVR